MNDKNAVLAKYVAERTTVEVAQELAELKRILKEVPEYVGDLPAQFLVARQIGVIQSNMAEDDIYIQWEENGEHELQIILQARKWLDKDAQEYDRPSDYWCELMGE